MVVLEVIIGIIVGLLILGIEVLLCLPVIIWVIGWIGHFDGPTRFWPFPDKWLFPLSVLSVLHVTGNVFGILSGIGFQVKVLPNSFFEIAGGFIEGVWCLGLFCSAVPAVGGLLFGGYGWRNWTQTGHIGGVIEGAKTLAFFWVTTYAAGRFVSGIEAFLGGT